MWDPNTSLRNDGGCMFPSSRTESHIRIGQRPFLGHPSLGQQPRLCYHIKFYGLPTQNQLAISGLTHITYILVLVSSNFQCGILAETRGNQRKRARDQEDNRTTKRRKDAHLADDPLNLTLGLPSYSSQIPPVTSVLPPSPSPFSPPPLTTWPPLPADLIIAHYSTFSYLYQTGSSSTPIPPRAPTKPAARERTYALRRYRSSRSAENQKSGTIPPPFPWATNIRGEIHSQEYLESKEVTTITGNVQCRYCEMVYQVSYNLGERFEEVESIFKTWKMKMRERAPPMWKYPEPGRCEHCGHEKAVKPVIVARKSQINWLFLLVGQTLGFCKLQQLKYFCKHSKRHRTGAKDRVLYLTYLGLCKIVQPNRSLFDRETGSKK